MFLRIRALGSGFGAFTLQGFSGCHKYESLKCIPVFVTGREMKCIPVFVTGRDIRLESRAAKDLPLKTQPSPPKLSPPQTSSRSMMAPYWGYSLLGVGEAREAAHCFGPLVQRGA